MKKILSMILAVMMTVSVFSGCSKEPENVEENKNEIVIDSLQQSFTAVIYDEGDNKAFWEDMKTSFEAANQGVTINMIITKDAAYEVRDRILSGNSPDFVYLPSDEETGVTEALVKDRAMLELTDIETFAPSGAFENNICKPYGDGKAYVAPIFFETEGLIYNKELLSQNGFSVPLTWDDFIKIAEDCKNKKFEFFTYAGSEPDEFVDIFSAALSPVIGYSEMNKLLSCDEEAWKNENIKTFAEKIEKVTKLVVSGSSTKSKSDVQDCLKEGKVLFISGSTSDLEELNKDGEKYAICAYPALSGSQTNIASFSEMYIPVEAKEPELAKEFMKHIYRGDVASSVYPTSVFTAEFSIKSAANETLSDEFCDLVVDIFKGNVKAEEVSDKMIEYIKEY